MDDLYISNYTSWMDFQDHNHLEKIHDVDPLNPDYVHLGLFVFKVNISKVNGGYLHHDFKLSIESFETTFNDDLKIGTIIPGIIYNSSPLAFTDFLSLDDLKLINWKPIKSTVDPAESLKLDVYKSDLEAGEFSFSFHFDLKEQYFGFVFIPEITDSGLGEHFELRFYGTETTFKSKRPQVQCWVKNRTILFKENCDGDDGLPKKFFYDTTFYDKAIPYDYTSGMHCHFDYKDLGGLNVIKEMEIKSTDPVQNYSLAIQHIALKEKGKIVEIYGFNGVTDRCVYVDVGHLWENAYLEKANFISWSGKFLEFPWATLLWYGEYIFFADQEEFNECCRTYFLEHKDDECPVCGNPIESLKFSFIDITRIPHQIYCCSRPCLMEFQGYLPQYLKILTESNIDYLTGIGV